MDRDEISNIYRGPSIDATYQVAAYLAMRCQRRRFFRNQPIRNKNCLWQPCLLTDREEMSNLCRGSSINVSYKVLAHLVKHFQRRRSFRNQPIRNKNCLWQPCLLTDRDEMSNLYRGPTIDASYQVAVHLAKQFQRRRFFQKSNNQRKELPVAAIFVDVSERNEQSLQRAFQGCFLLNFSSFGKAVSEENFFQKTTDQRQELPVAAMFANVSERNEQSLQRTIQGYLLQNFDPFGQAVSEEEINQSETRIAGGHHVCQRIRSK